MTEAQGWVFIGLIALFVLTLVIFMFVHLYRTATDVVRKRIKEPFLSPTAWIWALLIFFVLLWLVTGAVAALLA
jgi:Na+/proline symporter